jgi:membrane-associated phospholipid phosphatase
VFVLAPGWPLWDLAIHAPWLTGPVTRLTEGCVLLTGMLVLLVTWRAPQGLRCLLAIITGLVALLLTMHGIAAVSFVARPFVAYHFAPLYPHSPDTSFPSMTTGYFAVVAVPVSFTWRKLGWAAWAITAEVAFGCVYVGVHYVTDVVAGAALGAGLGGTMWLLFGLPPLARLIAWAERILGRARLRRRTVAASQEP